MELDKCPRCLTETDRLITEKCGHIKCRECFIDDTNGCLDCLKSLEKPNDKENSSGYFVHNQPDVTCQDKLSDLESNSGDLCIDTEKEDSSESFCEVAPNSIPEAVTNINLIHNYSAENINDTNEQTEKFKILEQLIIPPKTKIEKFFREEEARTSSRKKEKKFPPHIVKLTENDEILYKCTICGKRFRSKNQQYYHIYCDNVEKKPFVCKICGKHLATSSHLNYHMQTHTDSKKYECTICSKTFCRNMSLQKHIKFHQGKFKFNCKECGITLNEKASLVAHLNKHKNIFPFVCKICGRKFSFKSNLTQHQISHSTDRKRFRCDHCGKDFGRKNSYNEHLLRHKKVKEFPCTICLKMFIDRKTLDRHMKIHGGSKIFICPFCTVRSARKDNLVRHIRNMHPKQSFAEALKKIKIVTDSNNAAKSKPLDQNNVTASTVNINNQNDQIDKEIVNNQIVVTSSVIRSIGNVKPVQIRNDCDLDLNIKETENLCEMSTHSKQEDTAPSTNCVENKKHKKKYDPCEIYRKILSATNDDDEDVNDSLLENEESCSNSKDIHEGCCSDGPEDDKKIEKVECSGQSNFSEMHWRKRTSQYFYTAL